jgi:hypothetical protein
VPQPVRLVTFVELEEEGPDRLAFSARLRAVLDDGRAVPLLTDRGWAESGLRPAGDDPWASVSEQAIADSARLVVGPDEPPRGRSQDEEQALHWQALAERLAAHGVAAEGEALRRLPHDVELGARLRARLASA